SADKVSQRQSSARPTENDMPPKIGAVPVSFDSDRIDEASKYQVTKMFLPPPAGSTKRRPPELFQPDQAAAEGVRSQIRSFIFVPKGDDPYHEIQVLEGSGGGAAQVANPATGASAPPPGFTQSLQEAGGRFGFSGGTGIGLGAVRPGPGAAGPGVP